MYSKLLLNRKKIMFILTIGAGVLLCSQSVHALPKRDGFITSGVNINIGDKTMDITASANNNVINWSSFNIGEGETVNFNDSNNYLNLIHDTKASEIDGNITGGGNIYLINPNGFLFGDNSSINVGNLYISSRTLSDDDISKFITSGINPLSIPATNLVGDIVNLGTMQANKVVLEGNIVTLQNDADIVATNNAVTINAVNAIEVGKKPDATYIVDAWTHNENITKKFNLISNYDDLKTARNNPDANYMLACDIDASPSKNENEGNGFAYIGTYNGIFNGLNHEIKNLYINKGQASGHEASHVGLFGNIGCSSVVKNLNMVDCEIHGVEGVAAITGCIKNGGKVINCSTDNSCKIYGTAFVGGIAGTTKGGSIVDCVNNAYVDGWNCVGGIVGIADSGDFTLENSINNGHIYCNDDPELKHYGHDWRYENSHVGGLIGYAGDGVYLCRITDCINYGVVDGTTYVGGIAGSFNGGSIDSCKNYAGINGINNVGGITGACISGLDYTLVSGNTNNGDVSGTEIVGGIVGMHLAGNIQGNNNFGKIYNNDVEVSGHEVFGADWSGEPMFGSETPTKPSKKPKQTQPMIDNAIYDGLMAADCLKPLISNDFQNFSKGTTLVGETIQATKDDEETVSSRKKLILKE